MYILRNKRTLVKIAITAAVLILLGSCHSKPVVNADAEQFAREGQTLYRILCARCHQAGGEGLLNVYPPVKDSDYMMADKKRSIEILLKGMEGEIVVNDVTYMGTMEKLALTDGEIARIMTFLRVKWNKGGDWVSEEDVKSIRKELGIDEVIHDPGHGKK